MRVLDWLTGVGTLLAVLLAGPHLSTAQQRDASPQTPSMPAWLAGFPGAAPEVHAGGRMVEAIYTTPAKPEDVVEHYRKLFEAANLPFQPNPDGIGMTIRGAATECDLLIVIHGQPAGTNVDVSCAAKSQAAASPARKPVEVITGAPANARPRSSPRAGAVPPPPPASAIRQPPVTAAEMQARHEQLVKELGIHPEYRDAPAPPLVWPPWLTHINGTELAIRQGMDESKKAYLESSYTSTQPMSAIYRFYQDLLGAHEYPVHSSKLATGQTISGIVQNAWGYVEGTNYPDGAPGPRTVVRVNFSRVHLNDPISVRMRITAYEFVAPKARF